MTKLKIILSLLVCFTLLSGGAAYALPHFCMMEFSNLVDQSSAMPDCHKEQKTEKTNNICKKCNDCFSVSFFYLNSSQISDNFFKSDKFEISPEKNNSVFSYILLAPPKIFL